MKKMNYLWISAAALAFLLYFFNVPIGYRIVALAIIILGVYFDLQSKLEVRLASFQDQLWDLQKSTEPMTDLKNRSYRLDVTILPNWDTILEKLASDNKISRDDLLEKMKGDNGINPGGWGLYYRGFRFVYFKDNISGMCQIWSDHYKTFVEDMKVQGWIFEKGRFNYELPKSLYLEWIFGPECIGIAWEYGGSSIGEELGKMPFWDIVHFFLELDHPLGARYAIKKFSDKLQVKLDETGTNYPIEDSGLWVLNEFNKDVFTLCGNGQWTGKYEVQAYDQIMPFHEFENVYYKIHIRIDTF